MALPARQSADQVPTGRARSLANLTGGSRKGRPNKATADIKALAGAHAATVIAELARLATQAESEAARVAAIKELLDRGFGKARQPVDHGGGDGDGGPIVHEVRIVGVAP